MTDGRQRAMGRAATRFLTGSAGRLTAFALDLGIASVHYWGRRLAGKDAPW